MSKEKLKKELHNLIDNTEDETILSMVRKISLPTKKTPKKNSTIFLTLAPKKEKNWKNWPQKIL